MPDTIRCAIYTRKSTEEGLDQEFNSLHAQREAAEAYIRSQRQLGWNLLAAHYDDGGFTGGNLERPALQQLLKDIETHRIDCVVVYKVDRLSRSLLDFARLIDRFDQQEVSFVSVTQQFNTTTSLGRLTLNILLSFAQFEREIIGERTRDKMSAARRKGKWTGGIPMLGYDVDPHGGKLAVNEPEAQRVRAIFALHEEHHSVEKVLEELRTRAWTTKSWTTKRGAEHAGSPFNRAALLRMLTNAIYVGQVEHKGVIYPGEQPPIVQTEVWERVNQELRAMRRGKAQTTRTPQNALLRGILFCKNCNQLMTPTYTSKSRRRFRYYICRGAQHKQKGACPARSVAAGPMEETILAQLRTALATEIGREQLNITEAEWKSAEEAGACGLMRSIIRRIEYDGCTGAVSMELHSK